MMHAFVSSKRRFFYVITVLQFGLLVTTTSLEAQSNPSLLKHGFLKTRCLICHDGEQKKGGLNLEELLNEDPQSQVKKWVKVERAIVSSKMPPKDEERLTANEKAAFAKSFSDTFVTPGGIVHPGFSRPRRLTREELQNSLEDILQVDIRVTVTNSRLHVIPDTIIEKFFSSGVRGASGFSNDAVTLSKESVDIQNLARCFSLVLTLLDSNRDARQKVLGHHQLPSDFSEEQAATIINRFAKSAFRRAITKDEAAAFLTVYRETRRNKSAYQSIKTSLLSVLLSPSFLYRFETAVEEPTQVVGYELATRLSYFLWSAPPDAELIKLAEAGKLRHPKILLNQTRRMLADPRRVALAENLGGEWFDYKKLRQQSAINKRNDRMAGFYRTQFEEALLFFDSLIRFDKPIFAIVDADWAYLDRHQTGIYRMKTKSDAPKTDLPAVNIHYRNQQRQIRNGNYEYKHAPLQYVQLTDPNRGGFITLGPTLSVTSTENRTSPIRRGVWVMERILGEHFEVPEDVPDLEATQKKAEKQRLNLSHNEILKLHSAQPGCSSCHQYIDPIGFGLEAYDQLGISRTTTKPPSSGEKLTWTPKLTPAAFKDHTWALKQPLVPGKETRIHFQYTKGRHRLDIRKVRLKSGKFELLDKHTGFTGNQHRNNIWFLKIPAGAPKTGWQLVAEIRGNGGTDSAGTITVAGSEQSRPEYKLPNGKTFTSPAELKKLLLNDYREQVIDNAVRRVLAYGLGRGIEPIDRPAIGRIKESLAKQDYRISALIEAVVLSYQFRHKE